MPDFPEDWDIWGEWTADSDGSEVRYRTCKAGSKCRGKNRQRRIRKVTTVWHEEFEDEFEPEVEEWSVDVSLGKRSKRLLMQLA